MEVRSTVSREMTSCANYQGLRWSEDGFEDLYRIQRRFNHPRHHPDIDIGHIGARPDGLGKLVSKLVSEVFRWLEKYGVPYRVIEARDGVSQSAWECFANGQSHGGR